MSINDWLEKHIEEQKGQRELLKKICFPYDPAELCEQITELDEMLNT
jgi:hypothetical protein